MLYFFSGWAAPSSITEYNEETKAKLSQASSRADFKLAVAEIEAEYQKVFLAYPLYVWGDFGIESWRISGVDANNNLKNAQKSLLTAIFVQRAVFLSWNISPT